MGSIRDRWLQKQKEQYFQQPENQQKSGYGGNPTLPTADTYKGIVFPETSAVPESILKRAIDAVSGAAPAVSQPNADRWNINGLGAGNYGADKTPIAGAVKSAVDTVKGNLSAAKSTTQNVEANMPYYQELASKETLSSDEKQAARRAYIAMYNANAPIIVNGQVNENKLTDTEKEYFSLYNALYNKANGSPVVKAAQAAGAGFIDATGADFVADKIKNIAIPGSDNSVQKQIANYESGSRLGAAVGQIGGGLALLGGVSGITDAALKKYGVGALSKTAENIAKSAAAFGTVGGWNSITSQIWNKNDWDLQQKNYYAEQIKNYEAMGGTEADYLKSKGVTSTDQLYKPYSAWRNIGNIILDTVTSALGGGVGSAAGQIVGGSIMNVLKNSSLSARAMATVASTGLGITFAGTSGLIYEAKKWAQATANGETYKFDANSFAMNIVVAGIFSALHTYTEYSTAGSGAARSAKTDKKLAEEWFTADDMSNPEKLKKAYHTLSKQYHPDVGGDTATFQKINDAYQAALRVVGRNVVNRVYEAAADKTEKPAETPTTDNTKQAVQLLNEFSDFGSPSGEYSNIVTETGPAQSNDLASPQEPIAQQTPSTVTPASPEAPAQQTAPTTPEPASVNKRSEGIKAVDKAGIEQTAVKMEQSGGTAGANALRNFYDDNVPAADFYADFAKVYEAGRNGKSIDSVPVDIINEPTKKAAYLAGQADAKRTNISKIETATKPAETEPTKAAAPSNVKVPETAATEAAKAKLKRGVKMPVEGKNEDAILAGLKSGTMTIDDITYNGNVVGFNAEQRNALVNAIIEGAKTDNKTIHVDVPFDGKFEIENSPYAITKVLSGLKVKVIQDVLFTKELDALLRKTQSVDYFQIDEVTYITNGYAIIAIDKSAIPYAIETYHAKELNANVAREMQDEYTRLESAPYKISKGKRELLVFVMPDGSHKLFPYDFLKYFDGNRLYIGKNNEWLKATDLNGDIVGYLLPIHKKTDEKEYIENILPEKMRSFSKKMMEDIDKELHTKSLKNAQNSDTIKPEEKPAEKAPEAKPAEAEKTSSEKLADMLKDRIGSREFTSAELFKMADEAFGGTQAQGTYSPKDAYDALELAVNRWILDSDYIKKYGNLNSTANANATDKMLVDMLNKLPTQTKRTEEQQTFQQFSTPPNIAYLAAWTANITGSDVVLEPSAGIGGLAVFPKAWGAKVIVNELSSRRLGVLKSMGFDRVFNENAEQIDNILPDDIKPSVVIMNPPFSSTAGRTSTNKTANATKHIEQALSRLSDGGRLVAILGKGMSDNSSFSGWWNTLRKSYDIRANIAIDGENYKKYGTTWGVQLVVIDKTGPQTGDTITGEYKDLSEVPGVLEGIRNDRTSVQGTSVGSSGSVPERRNANTAAGEPGERHQGSPERTDGSPAGSERGAAGQSAGGRGPVLESGNAAAVEQGTKGGNRQQPAKGNGAVSEHEPVTAEQLGGDRPVTKQPLQQLSPKKASKNDNGVYAEYVPENIPFRDAVKHPAPLVESAAMAAVQSPAATYVPNLPASLIKSGALSDAQIENIVNAGQAHSEMLPNGERKGYFIGDGTGVGKGRQISGIILDNFRQGRKKAVWVSKNSSLYEDAVRDWTDIGGDKGAFIGDGKGKLKANEKVTAKSGILFTTYDTLRSASKDNKAASRLDQLVDWLGEDFDGVIAFDEAHNMGNLLGKQDSRGKTKGSAKAEAGVELQRRLPKARVIYVSATGATDVNELAYATRLGLWGQGTAFNDVNDFVAQIGSSGLAAMELVARDMKSMGVYLARSISYDGVEYDTLQHDLTPEQREIYDTMSRAWQITIRNVNEALGITGGNLSPQARSSARSAYYGAMQRFYNQVLTSMSMPSVIEDIRKELGKGHSAVLQIVNTNEAELNRQLTKIKEQGGELDDLDLTPRGTLIGYLENSFPIYAYEEFEDEDGNKHSRVVTDSAGNPVINKQAVKMRDDLIAQINQMSIPDGPLEMLFNAFGADEVAEVTGRTRRVVPRKNSRGETVMTEERRTPNHNSADVQAFQDGKKRILVFSDAGGTGKSYHADVRAKNQQKRIHYLIQPGWSATAATQGFGRTHRSNEVSTPTFRLVTTDIMGQKRFVSTIARRLNQLGALTKGQRETGSGMFTDKDNLESDLARDALRSFYDRLGKGQLEGLNGQSVLEKLGLWDKFTDEYGGFELDENLARDMNTFLNRILSLEVDEQNNVFGEFYRIFEEFYDKAVENGTLDLGMENVKADKIEILDDKVIRTQSNGAATKYVQAKTYRKPKLLTSVSQLEKLRGNPKDFLGLYRTDAGEVKAVYRIADKTDVRGRVQKMFRMQTPILGKYGTWSEATLSEKGTKIDAGQWETAWSEEVAKAPEYDEETVHMLTGTLLPIWNYLPKDGNTRAMRIIADDGSQYLGRVIPAGQIDTVLSALGAGKRTRETYTPADLADRVLKKGQTVKLMNDRMKLKRSRVSGEWRIEITGQNLWFLPRNYPDIITENINYNNRYFIPTGEKGIAIIEKLVNDNPVAEVVSSNETDAMKTPGKADHMLATVPIEVRDSEGKILTEQQAEFFKNSQVVNREGDLLVVYHTTYSDEFTVFDKSRLGENTDGNATDFMAQTAHVGFWFNTSALTDTYRGGRTEKVYLNIENPYQSSGIEDLAYDIENAGGSKEFTELLLSDGYDGIEVSDEEFGGTSFVAFSSSQVKRVSNRNPTDNEAIDKLLSDTATGRWNAPRNSSAEGGKVIPLSDIINRIRHDFGIPVTKGHIHNNKVAGTYDRHSHGIRAQIINDLPTVCHELGHHLDNVYGITEDISQSLASELVDGLSQGMKDAYPEKKWKTEGLAEFLRQYLQSIDEAGKKYPKFALHFLTVLSAEDKAAITELADEVNAYYALGGDTATSAIRFTSEGGIDYRTNKEKAQDMGDNLYQAVVDSNHAIKLFDRAAGSNAYMYATNAAYADNVVEAAVTGDLYDLDGNRVCDGLRKVLKDVNVKDKNEWREFNEYLVVRHAPERFKYNLRVFADDRLNTAEWCQHRQSELEAKYPKFRETSDKLYKFENTFNRAIGEGYGILAPGTVDRWEEKWSYHVPLQRAIPKVSHRSVSPGFADQRAPVYKAKGSGLEVIIPVENLINNMTKMINAAIRNRPMQMIAQAATETEGLASYLERVAPPLKMNKVDISGVKKDLTQSLEESDIDADGKVQAEKIVDSLDDILIQFQRGTKAGDVLTVLVDGKPQYWKINDKMMLESLVGMEPHRLAAVGTAIGRVNRFMVSNITGSNILWSMFSNMPRDIMTYLTFAKDRSLIKLFSGIASTYANMIRGEGADALYKEYMAIGGAHSSPFTADKDFTRNVQRKISGDNKLKWLNPLEWIDFVSDAIERAPRYAYYRLLRSKGYTPQEAFYGAMDITTNFRRCGTETKTVNNFVPFLTANIAGLDKAARFLSGEEDIPSGNQAKEQRKKTAAGRFGAFVAASAILAALNYIINNKDDEAKKNYAQLSTYTKNSYWCIPLGEGKYFAIPKPRELAVLTSLIEASIEAASGNDQHAFDDFWTYASDQLLPNMISDLAHGDIGGAIGSLGSIGIIEQLYANKDFLGRPIVPNGMQYLEPKDQYDARTSKIAYWLGQAFNVSPKQIDFAFNNLFGGYHKVIRALLPVGSENVDWTLGVQNTYVKDNQYSTDIINRLYDGSDAATKAKNSNPADGAAAAKAKWYSTMTNFYANYSKAAKSEDSNSSSFRATRQTVLSMISEFQKNMDNGYTNPAQSYIEGYVKTTGDTDVMPAAMPITIKDDDGKTYDLSSKEYVQLQTEYLGLYYEYVGSAADSAQTASIENIGKVLTAAKAKAKSDAIADALYRQGVTSKDYSSNQKANSAGVTSDIYARFEAALKNADTDGNGYIKKSEAQAALKTLPNLTPDQIEYLYHQAGNWK